MRLVMFAMLMLAGAAGTEPALAIPPEIPPPPTEQMKLAIEVWRNQSLEPHAHVWGNFVAARTVAQRLSAAKFPKSPRRQAEYSEQIRPVLNRIMADRFELLTEQALPCMAEPLARSLSLEQLKATNQFVRTEAGKAFWTTYLSNPYWQGCYLQPLSDAARPALAALSR